MDIRLRRKEECRNTNLGGGYFEDFDVIPPTPGTSTEANPNTISTQKKTLQDTKSTVSSTPEEPTITQEPGT